MLALKETKLKMEPVVGVEPTVVSRQITNLLPNRSATPAFLPVLLIDPVARAIGQATGLYGH